MTVEDNKALIRSFVENAFANGDLAHLDDYFAPESVNRGQSGAATPSGRDAFAQTVRSVHAAFPDIRVSIDDVIGEADKVVIRLSWDATHTAPFMGISPTGKRVHVQAMNIYRVEDGRIAERWGGPDLLGLLKQLGAEIRPG